MECPILFCLLLSDTELSAGRPALREQHCVCEGSTCEPGHHCTGQQCFSSLKMIDGVAVQQKGCLKDDQEGRATCAMPPSLDNVVKCCQGHLCNMNVTVQAPGKGDFIHMYTFLFPQSLQEFVQFCKVTCDINMDYREHCWESPQRQNAGNIAGCIMFLNKKEHF